MGIKEGLDHTLDLLMSCGNPHHQLRTIHIAGTNGKGSTSSMLASILRSAGYRVGLYTSPHLIKFNERITINEQLISDDEIILFLDKYHDEIDRIQSTFFETTTVMALNYFYQKKVDIAIIEVGLGGRLDSTNVISPQITAITPISLDHQHILGNDILKIAKEKSGIIKRNTPLVLSNQDQEVYSCIHNIAEKMNSSVIDIGNISDINLTSSGTEFKSKWGKFNSPLIGYHQSQNSTTAIAIAKTFDSKINKQTIQDGLNQTKWKGRLQKISNNLPIYYDVAHNAKGINVTIESIVSIYNSLPHIVISIKGDKDIELISNALIDQYKSLIITGSKQLDLMSANQLFKYFKKNSNHMNIQMVDPLENSFDILIDRVKSSHNPGIIMGSHYLAKAVFDKFGIFK
ncbi:MAG: folylpolyglutamate synthase/dihydrofolate synthase family protein [Candidatus Neomarinimicrobiota bacterium]|nr:folylpolyglutamate synthase/dihydrofolate synthase family protein [Candidatus Neomarinimicrobiota bacterium]